MTADRCLSASVDGLDMVENSLRETLPPSESRRGAGRSARLQTCLGRITATGIYSLRTMFLRVLMWEGSSLICMRRVYGHISYISRRCPLLATFLSVAFCLLALLFNEHVLGLFGLVPSIS